MVGKASLVGGEASDRPPSGLWPSSGDTSQGALKTPREAVMNLIEPLPAFSEPGISGGFGAKTALWRGQDAVGRRAVAIPSLQRQRALVVSTLIVAALTTLAGCGAPNGADASAPSASPRVGAPSLSASSLGATPSPRASASGSVGQSYSTTSFKVPLVVIVEPHLKSPPSLDSPGLLSWDAVASTNEKVRFLIPVELYPPGSSTPQPPPANYLEYLRGQAAQGARFSNIATITVGGHAATLMTATTSTSMDGSLGCPVLGADRGEGCYGLQADLSLRIAVIEMGPGSTLLAWARTGIDAPDDAFVSMFERMLASVQIK
jgi:hypothetical protein